MSERSRSFKRLLGLVQSGPPPQLLSQMSSRHQPRRHTDGIMMSACTELLLHWTQETRLKVKMRSLMPEFQVAELKLSGLSDLLRNQD